jgi:uncharacterized protein YdcH (DUF465 family)
MLHEYKEIISKLKVENPHFAKIFEKHNELDDKIQKAESGEIPLDTLELDKLKREKLALKDEAYAMILEYKKANNL